MHSDKTNLLRALLYVQTEAARLGFTDASEHVAIATQIIVSSPEEDRRTVLSDEIFSVVEKMTKKDREDDGTY